MRSSGNEGVGFSLACDLFDERSQKTRPRFRFHWNVTTPLFPLENAPESFRGGKSATHA